MNYNWYLHSIEKWPLPVLRVPKILNPFEDEGVELSVVPMNHLPYENLKFLTVFGLLEGAEKKGMLCGIHTLVEATSGNTGIALATMAKSFGVPNVNLVVADDLPEGKRLPLVMAGAKLISSEERKSGIETARKLGEQDGWLNLDQYSNIDGTELHRTFTAPQILKQVTHRPTVFVAGMGTGGSLIGISNCFRQEPEKITVVGVLLKQGNEIPGVRDLGRMKEITLPWRKSLDDIVEIESRPSYLAALWFNWVMGITPGPSSGFAYLGALKFLWQNKVAKELDSLRNEQGRIHVVILFPDGNRPYGDRFMANLPTKYLKISTAPRPWQFPGSEVCW